MGNKKERLLVKVNHPQLQKQAVNEWRGRSLAGKYDDIIGEVDDSLICPLKLFLFLQITVHIFQNSAFRNPFVPAGKHTATNYTATGRPLQKEHSIVVNATFFQNLLFVPAAVMNKVFDLFILDVDLNTLWKKRQWMVGSVDGNDKKERQSRRKKAHLCFVEQWPMKTQHSFTWTGDTQHRMTTLNIVHTNPRNAKHLTSQTDVLVPRLPTTIWNLKTFPWFQWGKTEQWTRQLSCAAALQMGEGEGLGISSCCILQPLTKQVNQWRSFKSLLAGC